MGDRDAGASTSGYIDHTVSRLDTLAGVAIKYGVEVADVKRFNGLTTDLQMFALKTLRIPTPGRHPPTSAAAAASSSYSSRCENLKSPTMELLRDYYGLPSTSSGGEIMTDDLDDEEVLLPMFRPPSVSERYNYDRSCGYEMRESCNNLLDSCWSREEVASSRSAGKKETEMLQLPVRRRTTRSDHVVNYSPKKDPPRPHPRFADQVGAAATIKSAVESLLSKVTPQEMSVLEGITSAYRHAKAALD